MSEVNFSINGHQHKVSKLEADTSLNSYLRNHADLRGTKAMCHEGGCGACVVSVTSVHPVSKEKETYSVNSCLVSVLSCHGWEVTTVEGIGDRSKGYHPIQKRLASFNGTQCGYCTPGWVMNMYSLYETKKHDLTMKEVENSFAGSLCRCTGYRPILDAFKSFSKDADESLLDRVVDIEEIMELKRCAKSGLMCKCPRSCNENSENEKCVIKPELVKGESLELDSSRGKWFKVYSLKEIFDVFKNEGTDSYMLVAGNTAQGVYPVKEIPRIMIDIMSVPELRKHEKTSSLNLGGNMSLNEIMTLFQSVGKTDDEYSYTEQMCRHMDLVAHVPVRNIGTLAGNLMIKHQHNEFQSDMFVLFEAVGATLTIADANGQQSITLLNFLKTDMKGKIIYSVNLPPLFPNYVFHSYKIMPRAQNAHAHVNAAFLFQFDEEKTTVKKARIVYGAIRPEFSHATMTESFLVNKNIFTQNVLKLAIQSLNSEIFPENSPPEPSPEYRKMLAVGLFYKFILHISPPGLLDPKNLSGGIEFDRPVSSGKQKFDTRKDVYPLNQPIPKIEALVQCSGEAKFANDLSTQPNEVYAAFVLSTVPNGEIDIIDGSDALQDNTVITLYTAKDIPGVNDINGGLAAFQSVEEILCSGKILFHGQPVAIVVAETERSAKLAAEKVKVTYKNVSSAEPLLTIRDVLKSNQKDRINKDKTVEPKSKGDDIQHVIKGSFDFFGQYHYTMEPQTCVCVPIEDGIDVYSSSQWPDHINVAVAKAINVPVNSINVNIRRLGGGYGSKISRAGQIATACAICAKLLNRPVRFVMSIESNMAAIGKRLSTSCDYEVGVNKDGKIQYLKNVIYEDDGSSHNENVAPNALTSTFNCYDTDTWYVEANSVLTDKPSNTWCRAPGSTEGVAIIENIMDHIATVVEKDPLEVRLLNMINNKDNPLPELIDNIKETSEFDERTKNVENFNNSNRWRKRGISVIPLKYPLDYWGNFNSLVSIYHADGTIAISHAGVEMGQGINTKIAQVCAHTLGVPLEMVQVKPTNNLVSPNAMVTGGSIGSEVCCFATIKACQILLDRLEPIKKQMTNPTWKELITKAYFSGVDLCAHHMFTVADGLKEYDIWAVSVIEVELDMITGNHQILRVDILEDTGESLSPLVDVGQVEGSMIMGFGYWTSENLVYDKKTGALLTNRTWNYKPPGAKDIPIDFRVAFRRNAPNPAGVLRSKATGEPPLNMSFGIVSAIRQAITSVRTDNGLSKNEWYKIDMPLTTENIITATETKIGQFEL